MARIMISCRSKPDGEAIIADFSDDMDLMKAWARFSEKIFTKKDPADGVPAHDEGDGR